MPNSFIVFALLISYLSLATIQDLREKMISNRLTYIYAFVFFIFQLIVGNQEIITNALLGAVIGISIPGLIHMIHKEAIGLGDVKLLGTCGIILGISDIINLIVTAMFVSFIVSIVLLLFRKVKIKTELPFVPFILVGALLIHI